MKSGIKCAEYTPVHMACILTDKALNPCLDRWVLCWVSFSPYVVYSTCLFFSDRGMRGRMLYTSLKLASMVRGDRFWPCMEPWPHGHTDKVELHRCGWRSSEKSFCWTGQIKAWKCSKQGEVLENILNSWAI